MFFACTRCDNCMFFSHVGFPLTIAPLRFQASCCGRLNLRYNLSRCIFVFFLFDFYLLDLASIGLRCLCLSWFVFSPDYFFSTTMSRDWLGKSSDSDMTYLVSSGTLYLNFQTHFHIYRWDGRTSESYKSF